MNLPPSSPGIGSKLKIPRLIVISDVRLNRDITDSLIFIPESAASPIASTSPTGPDKSLKPYFPVTRSFSESHTSLAVETVSLAEYDNTFSGVFLCAFI